MGKREAVIWWLCAAIIGALATLPGCAAPAAKGASSELGAPPNDSALQMITGGTGAFYSATATPIVITPQVVNGTGDSNVEHAHAILAGQGMNTVLVLIAGDATGVEGDIYRDLIRRYFRVTTGPDEGIDTRGLSCYPGCLFVLKSEANALSVGSWVQVLEHEYRHVIQLQNNPNMAEDFRGPDGLFTTYAAFSEACADYGLNVAPIYHAQARMDQVRSVLGPGQQPLIDQACQGGRSAYQSLMDQYNQLAGSDFAFQRLFPPYS